MEEVKLKEVMREIMSVISKYDIAGQVILKSQNATEVGFKVNTSWTIARFDPLDNGTFALEFDPPPNVPKDFQKRRALTQNTIDLLAQIRDLNGRHGDGLNQMLKDVVNTLNKDLTKNIKNVLYVDSDDIEQTDD